MQSTQSVWSDQSPITSRGKESVLYASARNVHSREVSAFPSTISREETEMLFPKPRLCLVQFVRRSSPLVRSINSVSISTSAAASTSSLRSDGEMSGRSRKGGKTHTACDHCFKFKKTSFYEINNVGQVTKMIPKFATVNPSKSDTKFWTVFSELGGGLDRAELQQARQLLFFYWKTALTLVAGKVNPWEPS